MPHECNTSNTNATQLTHECNTSPTQVQHECYTNDTSATRVLHERHDCDTSENFDFVTARVKAYFHTLIFCYMASERLQGEEQFDSKNYFLKMSLFHAKMRSNSAPQKLNFLMEKATSRSCTVDCSYKCPCTFPHSYAQ